MLAQRGIFCEKFGLGLEESLPPQAILTIFTISRLIELKFCTHIIRQCMSKFIPPKLDTGYTEGPQYPLKIFYIFHFFVQSC